MTTADEFEVREPLLLVSIAQTYRDGADVYEAARFAWKLDVGRAEQYALVLAHSDGIVRGAFRPERWMQATSENFPGRGDEPDRWGFVGRDAEPEVADYYVGKRVPDDLRGQTPVRYCDRS